MQKRDLVTANGRQECSHTRVGGEQTLVEFVEGLDTWLAISE